jgi:hypothetical protein
MRDARLMARAGKMYDGETAVSMLLAGSQDNSTIERGVTTL